MKKLTARITMSVEVPEEEYSKIITDDTDDIEVTGELLELFKTKGYIDEDYGDSYIPGSWIEYELEKEGY